MKKTVKIETWRELQVGDVVVKTYDPADRDLISVEREVQVTLPKEVGAIIQFLDAEPGHLSNSVFIRVSSERWSRTYSKDTYTDRELIEMVTEHGGYKHFPLNAFIKVEVS